MKNEQLNKMAVGTATGILLPVLGFFLIVLMLSSWFPQYTMDYFYRDVFTKSADFQAAMVTLSLLINIAPFYIYLNMRLERAARGVLLSFFLYAPVIVYLKFF